MLTLTEYELNKIPRVRTSIHALGQNLPGYFISDHQYDQALTGNRFYIGKIRKVPRNVAENKVRRGVIYTEAILDRAPDSRVII